MVARISVARPAARLPAAGRSERWSGREDLNLRLHGPEPCALPGCATPRRDALIVQGRRACTRSSSLPGVLPDKLDEFALAAETGLHLAADLLDHRQRLIRDVADGHHHATALGELLEERRGDRRAAGGDEDPVEGRLVRPAERAAAHADPDVVVAELLEQTPGPFGQARQPLDRANPSRELGQHRGLVAGARADLQDLLLAPELEELGHEPDDVGLGDRLLLADRQRMVAVGAVAKRLFDEEMAWDPSHRGEHALVGDSAMRELLLDHPRA